MIITIEKTTEEKAKDILYRIDQRSNASLDMLKHNLELNLQEFWENNPQAQCDVLGNGAYKIFKASSDTIEFIQKFDPTYNPSYLIGNFAINQDGTVTIL